MSVFMRRLVGALIGLSILTFLSTCGEVKEPTARCLDGTYSYSANHRGTCSWHGGVAEWYK